jgi:hypothetical protein
MSLSRFAAWHRFVDIASFVPFEYRCGKRNGFSAATFGRSHRGGCLHPRMLRRDVK